MAAPGAVRPWRALLALLAIFAVVFGVVAATGSWEPRLGLDLRGGTSITLTAETPDGEDPSPESMDEAVEIIRARVNGSGVAEAEVAVQGSDTIVVQVPGVGEDELVELVGTTAELRFRPVLDTRLGPGTAASADTGAVGQDGDSGDGSRSGAGDGDDPANGQDPAQAPEPSGESVEEGGDGQSSAEVQALPAGDQPDGQQPAAGKPSSGQGDAGQGGDDQPAPTATDPDTVTSIDTFSCADIDPAAVDDPDQPLLTCDREGITRYLLGPADIEGTDIATASAGIPPNDVSWVVNIEFTSSGADKFYESTEYLSQQAPPQNQFAIVLDGVVVSAPAVNEPIPDGQAQITGQFSQQEAEALANVLKYGALPLTFVTSEVSTVSPTLGADQLRAGLIAGAFGIGLVVLYALFYYRLLGLLVAASLGTAGLLTYGLVLLLGEAIGFTLTLAGVAGLIVAIGITADSFVVLLERVKDEVREGRSSRMAVEKGWVRARKTIIASDVVSLLAAFFLYSFSVGGVRGFAFALGLTTLVDLVVVFLFTKPILTLLVRSRLFLRGHPVSGLSPARLGRDPQHPATGLAGLGNRLYRGETSVEFVGRAKRWYAASAGLLGIAVLGLVLNGLTLGIEFTGGAEFNAQKEGVDEQVVGEVRDSVVDTGIEAASDPVVQVVGDDRVRVVTGDLSTQESNEVRDAMAETLDVPATDVTVQLVGPSWGAEITTKALQGLALFLVAVVIYLAISFEPKMAIAALAALAHDVLATVGIYALTGFDVTPASVIGFLTILGYSLYDTVVVFDKVRENTRGITSQSKQTYSEAANLAINQTLVRSVNTSVIALLPIGSILLVSLAALGTGTLKDLALALFVGVAVGTYSSIFIATPLLADMREREPVMRGLRQRVLARRAAGRGAGTKAGAGAVTSSAAAGSATIGGPSGKRSHQPSWVRDAADQDDTERDDTERDDADARALDRVAAPERSGTRAFDDAPKDDSGPRPGSAVESAERHQPRRQSRARRRKRT